jgi:hypothetical protein
MFGFLKKLFGFGSTTVETKPAEQVGFVAQEVVQVIPEAIKVDETPLVVLGPEVKPAKKKVEVTGKEEWPFPSKRPVEGKKSAGKPKGKKPVPKKKPTSVVTPQEKKPTPAPAKKTPAARTPAKKKTK